MQFSGFIEALGSAGGTEEAFHLLCQTVSPLGWKRMAFFALTPEARQLLTGSGDDSSPLIASNYPEEYISRYVRERHYEIDPVLLLARESLTPLVGKDVEDSAQLSERQKQLMIDRRVSGLYREVVCPIHGPGGQTSAVCFAREGPEEWDRAHFSALQVLAMHFYHTFARLVQARPEPARAPAGLAESEPVGAIETPSLTQRERECLLWTARGKSASMISVILGLSENTINFYVKNAMKKLGTTNRVIAVVLAVRSGMIQP
jgi:LuxR family transcriptional regulator, activator of conjugal transfer of Ti plasmids